MRLSIVTPVLDRRATIGAALDSVRRQGVDGCEHLVVDGGSTDGTRDIVAAAPGARLIEAPGTSIYEALNLGICEASGGVIGLLNSDDLLAEGALKAVLSAFEAEPAADIVQGRFRTIALDGGAPADSPAVPAAVPQWDLGRFLLDVPAVNASFMARPVFRRVGLFDTGLKIAADREWMARAWLAGVSVKTLDQVLYVYRAHRQSLTIGGGKAAELEWVREHLAIARRYLADPTLDPQSRKAFAAFHGKEVAHEVVLLLRRGKVRAAAAALTGASLTRAVWPVDALAPILRVAMSRLRRAGTGGLT